MSDPCMQGERFAKLEAQSGSTSIALERLEGKLDQVLLQVQQISLLENERRHHSEALERAFKRIDELEGELKELGVELGKAKDFIAHTKGMGKMAMVFWTLMSGGMITVIVKVFGQ